MLSRYNGSKPRTESVNNGHTDNRVIWSNGGKGVEIVPPLNKIPQQQFSRIMYNSRVIL